MTTPLRDTFCYGLTRDPETGIETVHEFKSSNYTICGEYLVSSCSFIYEEYKMCGKCFPEPLTYKEVSKLPLKKTRPSLGTEMAQFVRKLGLEFRPVLIGPDKWHGDVSWKYDDGIEVFDGLHRAFLLSTVEMHHMAIAWTAHIRLDGIRYYFEYDEGDVRMWATRRNWVTAGLIISPLAELSEDDKRNVPDPQHLYEDESGTSWISQDMNIMVVLENVFLASYRSTNGSVLTLPTGYCNLIEAVQAACDAWDLETGLR